MTAALGAGRWARAGRWLGTLGGIGRAPVAPGTVGGAAAAVAAAALPATAYGWALPALLVAAVALAPACARAAAAASGVEDPRSFVLDEAAGMWLALLRPAPPGWAVIAVTFAAFRLFDIWKPGPIRRLERVGGGWGVLLDDLAAGALALVVSIGFGAAAAHIG